MSTQTPTRDGTVLLSPADAAKLANVSRETIYREIDRGALPALHRAPAPYRPGRVPVVHAQWERGMRDPVVDLAEKVAEQDREAARLAGRVDALSDSLRPNRAEANRPGGTPGRSGRCRDERVAPAEPGP